MSWGAGRSAESSVGYIDGCSALHLNAPAVQLSWSARSLHRCMFSCCTSTPTSEPMSISTYAVRDDTDTYHTGAWRHMASP